MTNYNRQLAESKVKHLRVKLKNKKGRIRILKNTIQLPKTG